jgi:hypothetical protein
MSKVVVLTFENKNKEQLNVEFKTLPNIPQSVIDIWARKFKEFLQAPNAKLETRWSGFKLERRPKEFLINKLQGIINKINTSWLNTEYGYYIPVEHIPEDYPIEIHNEVHHHFEILIGQHWNHSKWWDLVCNRNDGKEDMELVYAIKGLNEISHELEEYTMKNFPPHIHTLFIHGKEKHSDLSNEDLPKEVYSIFDIGSIAGGVYLQYNQTGKTMVEVIDDHDEHIDYENISAHRLVNGSISISFQDVHRQPEQKEKKLKEYRDFMIKHNLDINDPNLALGRPLIGQIKHDNITELQKQLCEFDQLVGMEIDGISREFEPYFDTEFDFD